jgi:TonB family protein
MFDTSLVKTRASAARYRLLTVSLAVHSAAIIGALSLSVASVELPTRAPDQFELLRPVSLPPPLGPGGPPKAPDKPTQPPKPVVVPPRDVVPVEIPSTTPAAGPVSDTPVESAESEEEGGEGGGHPLGVPGGVGTDIGGTDLIAGPPVTDVVHVPGGDVRPATVLRRVEPRYPSAFARAGVAATVRIRCIIDRNGRIRDVEIVDSSFPPFNQSVLDALQQWTFLPGSMRGQAVDTYFELTVTFRSRG